MYVTYAQVVTALKELVDASNNKELARNVLVTVGNVVDVQRLAPTRYYAVMLKCADEVHRVLGSAPKVWWWRLTRLNRHSRRTPALLQKCVDMWFETCEEDLEKRFPLGFHDDAPPIKPPPRGRYHS